MKSLFRDSSQTTLVGDDTDTTANDKIHPPLVMYAGELQGTSSFELPSSGPFAQQPISQLPFFSQLPQVPMSPIPTSQQPLFPWPSPISAQPLIQPDVLGTPTTSGEHTPRDQTLPYYRLPGSGGCDWSQVSSVPIPMPTYLGEHQFQQIQSQHQLQPIQGQYQIQPIQGQHQFQPMHSQLQIQPIQSQHQLQPIQDQHQFQPMHTQQYLQPMHSQLQVQPMHSQYQLESIQSQQHFQPFHIQQEVQQIQNQPTHSQQQLQQLQQQQEDLQFHAPLPLMTTPTGHRTSATASGRNKSCSNCGVIEAPTWRRHPHTGASMCNACGLYVNLHDKEREWTINARGQTVVKRQPRGSMARRRNQTRAARTARGRAVDQNPLDLVRQELAQATAALPLDHALSDLMQTQQPTEQQQQQQQQQTNDPALAFRHFDSLNFE